MPADQRPSGVPPLNLFYYFNCESVNYEQSEGDKYKKNPPPCFSDEQQPPCPSPHLAPSSRGTASHRTYRLGRAQASQEAVG